MIWTEQDCAEMPLLASEKIKALEKEIDEASENLKILAEETAKVEEELEAENKVLKEANSGLADVVADCEDEIEALKKSRDELLVACKLLCVEKHDNSIHSLIRKTEVRILKEKEA